MKIIDVDGKREYQFEDDDLLVCREFERSIYEPDAKDLVDAIIKSLAAQQQRKTEAWRLVEERIIELDPDYIPGAMSYNPQRRAICRIKDKGQPID